MRKEYSTRKLFDQQCFFKKIFDLDEAITKECSGDLRRSLQNRKNYQDVKQLYANFKRLIEHYLELNDYNKVDLSFIFAPMVKN